MVWHGTSIIGTIWDGGIRSPAANGPTGSANTRVELGAEVYTPAMVVNGAAMMVGSDRNAVRQAIDQAIPPRIAVTARRTPSGLELEIAPTATPLTGLLATYDPEHSTPVGAGENGGRRLWSTASCETPSPWNG